MPKIFDGPVPTPWHAAVCPEMERLARKVAPSDMALHENLEIDGRVPSVRRDEFLRHFVLSGGSSPLPDMERALRTFKSPPDANEVATVHGSNLVFTSALSETPRISDRTLLVSIQQIFPLWAESLREWIHQSAPAGIGTDREESLKKWLSRRDKPGLLPDDLKKSIAETWNSLQIQRRLSGALAGARREFLSWAGLWEEFKQHGPAGPARWLQVLGMGKWFYSNLAEVSAPTQQWFVVFRYSVGDTSYMLRPTVLEASADEWHFPYPARKPVKDGGKTVIFGTALDDMVEPRSEFVHGAVQFEPNHVWAVASLDLPRPSSVRDGGKMLARAREKHRKWVQSLP